MTFCTGSRGEHICLAPGPHEVHEDADGITWTITHPETAWRRPQAPRRSAREPFVFTTAEMNAVLVVAASAVIGFLVYVWQSSP